MKKPPEGGAASMKKPPEGGFFALAIQALRKRGA